MRVCSVSYYACMCLGVQLGQFKQLRSSTIQFDSGLYWRNLCPYPNRTSSDLPPKLPRSDPGEAQSESGKRPTMRRRRQWSDQGNTGMWRQGATAEARWGWEALQARGWGNVKERPRGGKWKWRGAKAVAEVRRWWGPEAEDIKKTGGDEKGGHDDREEAKGRRWRRRR